MSVPARKTLTVMALVGCACMLVGVGAAGAREGSRGVTTASSACPDPNPTIDVRDNGNGTRTVIYTQSLAVNDNSYGTGVVGWGNQTHVFSDLTLSDNVELQLFNGNLQTVLDFFLDYLSPQAGTPSGYASLGPTGGDGSIVTGDAASILSWDTSLAANLNGTGYFAGGSQTPGTLPPNTNGADLLVNSPPTVSNSDYTLATPNPWTNGWEFRSIYTVTVSNSAFGPSGFGGVTLPAVHNSPAKPTCGPTAVAVASFTATRLHQGVRVRWRTGTEADLLGFQVYRSRAHSWKRLSRSLIVAKGSSSGGSYRFVDQTARRGVAYRYRLEAVNRDGTANWFGPVRAT